MPKTYPTELPEWVLTDTRRSAEIKVFRKFQKELSEDWIVFYSRPWWGLNKTGGEKDGEADFVLVHPDKGILFLEIKGGEIKYDPLKETWTSTDRHSITHTIKNPVMQAMSSKHQILRKLAREKDWPSHKVTAHYGVVFVDTIKPVENLIAGYETNLFCHAMEFDNDFSHWIESRLTSHKAPAEIGPGANGCKVITDVLAKPITLRTILARKFNSDLNQMETLLTGIQFQTLSEIEAEERVVIEGGAGTGKTVIACESAIRSAELGRKTLLCCVGEALLNDFKMRIKGVSNNLKIVSVSEAIRMVEKFETIIIDESQDVDWEYWDKLEGMLENKDSKLVCFMDANQAIYRVATDLVVRLGAKRNTLRVNMRNTKRIAVVVERLYQGPFLTTAGPEGTEPKISFFTNSDEVINEICTEISSLRNIEGVELSDIAVLSNDKEFLRKLRFALTNSRIMHCPAGNRVLSAVVVDSVLNFKGLESSVVLLHSLNEEGNDRELSYVGTSRARNYLHIYASDRNSIIAKALI